MILLVALLVAVECHSRRRDVKNYVISLLDDIIDGYWEGSQIGKQRKTEKPRGQKLKSKPASEKRVRRP